MTSMPSTESRLVDRGDRDHDTAQAPANERGDHGQDPGHRPHLGTERELADQRESARTWPHLLRAEQDPDRHRQVQRRARLAQVRRSEVDGDPPRRVDVSGVPDGTADPFTGLLERGIRHVRRS
jgi:hypothetical protein